MNDRDLCGRLLSRESHLEHAMRARYELFVHPIKTLRGLWYYYLGSAYDRWLGIETKRSVSDGRDVSNADPYDPTEPKYLFWVFRNLSIEAREYSFVDFGSGKGRVLIAAAKYPFLQVVGVEYSRDLHEAAMANIRSAKRMKCSNISSVCMDAKEFSIPETPCVLYFYNPFKGQTMDRVLSNIQESLLRSPRPLFLVYVHPVLHHVFIRQPGLRLLKSGNWCNLYSWRAES
jgi:SAM-dependent methyltransferase